MERKKIGEVFHFFGQIDVAAIRLTDGSLAIGDTVQIQGPTTNLEQTVDTLQIEHAAVSSADPGQEVGMKVRERVREKDFVYKLIPTAEPKVPSAAPPVPTAPRVPAAPRPARRASRPKPRRKTPRKKAPRKKATPKRAKPARKKATRAARSKARRGSRGSRRRSR